MLRTTGKRLPAKGRYMRSESQLARQTSADNVIGARDVKLCISDKIATHASTNIMYITE